MGVTERAVESHRRGERGWQLVQTLVERKKKDNVSFDNIFLVCGAVIVCINLSKNQNLKMCSDLSINIDLI